MFFFDGSRCCSSPPPFLLKIMMTRSSLNYDSENRSKSLREISQQLGSRASSLMSLRRGLFISRRKTDARVTEEKMQVCDTNAKLYPISRFEGRSNCALRNNRKDNGRNRKLRAQSLSERWKPSVLFNLPRPASFFSVAETKRKLR